MSSSSSSPEEKKGKKHGRDEEETKLNKKAKLNGSHSNSSSRSSSKSPTHKDKKDSKSKKSSPKSEKKDFKDKKDSESEKKQTKISVKDKKPHTKPRSDKKKDTKSDDKKKSSEKSKKSKDSEDSDFKLVIPSASTHEFQRLWEIPYIAHFTWLFQKPLNIDAILPEQLEHALAHPSTDPIFAEVMTKLIIDNLTDRNWLKKGEGFPFDILNDIIVSRFDAWFADEEAEKPVYNDDADDDEDHAPDAFSPREFFGHTNPLAINDLPSVKPEVLAQIMVGLCEYRLKTNEEFYKQLRGLNSADARVVPIENMMDSAGNQYFFFGYHDFRIYRQHPIFPKDVDKNTPLPTSSTTTSSTSSTSRQQLSARSSSQSISARATPVSIEFDLAARDQTTFKNLLIKKINK